MSASAAQHTSQNGRMVARKDFDAAQTALNIDEADQEVYDRLFTLFDKTGAGKVDYLELVVGLAPLIPGTLNERLLLGLQLVDEDGKGWVDKVRAG